jgi:hypothetical protein
VCVRLCVICVCASAHAHICFCFFFLSANGTLPLPAFVLSSCRPFLLVGLRRARRRPGGGKSRINLGEWHRREGPSFLPSSGFRRPYPSLRSLLFLPASFGLALGHRSTYASACACIKRGDGGWRRIASFPLRILPLPRTSLSPARAARALAAYLTGLTRHLLRGLQHTLSRAVEGALSALHEICKQKGERGLSDLAPLRGLGFGVWASGDGLWGHFI